MMDTPWQERRHGEDKHRRNDHRSAFQRDRARILHSAAFRRLQAKTQVLGVGMNDFYRTRLTHSLEVSQIGTGIAAQLKRKHPDKEALMDSMSLIESLCLAHDIGHPPFGHGGEVALNYMMRDHGGFEGNGQTFRILTKLEPYTPGFGMNLCRRTLLGILKYPQLASALHQLAPRPAVPHYRQLRPGDWTPVKAVFDDDREMLDWVLAPLTNPDRDRFTQFSAPNERHGKTRFKSLDATIMELADDIAYAVHDLEDAIVMGIVSREQWLADVAPVLNQSKDSWIQAELGAIDNRLFAKEHHLRKDAIGTLVNGFVTAINLIEDESFSEPLLRHNAVLQADFAEALVALKGFVYRHVIRKPEVQMLEYKGQQMVMQLFEAFASDPERLLPLNTRTRWQEAAELGQNPMRIIADYISGMTDEFAVRMHHQLFSPRLGGLGDLGQDF
ncbi:deoxyguanosinetriphosphate triphosphohydrolase family protein [Shewanella sp. JM162201]|uniref:Deoxyguanosinetriphosphate triphosphohydrolase-like protein n=1 Tax=Shewanella jiangmenensis TaxID=2837387 RepID=A0ABS5V6C6_9GAMM|nr:anti-phage deoxyguanosine triphosphatase [Shewanella jiangmenensis]MBT1445523.1 deoxyguanosinetriphosphate triphosphohydrolase family protein [Shewanella jiangmenensis]